MLLDSEMQRTCSPQNEAGAEKIISSKQFSPIVKWAGGKSRYLDSLKQYFPKSFANYFEPFVGSAAIYLAIKPVSATLGDLNEDLINFYNVLSADWRGIEKKLGRLTNDKSTYYAMRNLQPKSALDKAVRFIYLNRTCYNGLFRVNLDGKFNVPFGHNGRPVAIDRERLKTASIAFARATLLCCDFEKTCSKAKKNDLVFFDPPYSVAHENNGFVKYNASLFSWRDQERLKAIVDVLSGQGTFVVITNAAHDSIRKLYRGYQIVPFERSSTLSGAIHGRRQVTELVIRNF
jgi:DNA adenine methylase